MSEPLPLYPIPIHPLKSWLWKMLLIPKRELLRGRVHRSVTEKVLGRSFKIPPTVLNPVIFRTGKYFAEYIASGKFATRYGVQSDVKTALDVGTGSGVFAVFAAEAGYQVVAVDINQDAVNAARGNVEINGLSHKINVLESDLFEAVSDTKFDLIVTSLPYFRGEPKTKFDLCWRSDTIIERFAAGLADRLNQDGTALVLLTSHGDDKGMIEALLTEGFDVEVEDRKYWGNEILTIYAVRHPKT